MCIMIYLNIPIEYAYRIPKHAYRIPIEYAYRIPNDIPKHTYRICLNIPIEYAYRIPIGYSVKVGY